MRQELQMVLIDARRLPREELPRLIGDLEEVRATAMARLAAPVAAHPADQLLDARAAAHRLGVSPDYLYHNHRRFPFTRRQGRKLLFSADGIQAHIRSRR